MTRSCRGARAALDVQHGEVIVVTLVAKGSPPGAGNPEAEPLCAENSSIVSAAVVFVFILLYVRTSSPVCWEVAFASTAISKVLDLPGACECTATAGACSNTHRVLMPS